MQNENFKKIKAQSGIEFLIISCTLLFLFVMFFVAIQTNISERNREEENILIKNLALSIQNEVDLATKASEGYRREFYVQKNILGNDYEVKIIKDGIYDIYIKTARNAIALTIDEVEGEIDKGINIIKKEDGKVHIYQPSQ